LAADRHDAWNLMSLGALNVAHAGWWLGLYPAGPTVISTLFSADLCYILCDLGWLVFSPRCVAPAVWPTLIVHHGIVLCCVPTAWAKPVLMAHLLRTWIVEVHSWVHIAARKLQSPLLTRVNKPLFAVLRLVGFPLTWVAYARDRAAMPLALQAAHAPLRVHLPLSFAHFAMYGLMCKWGYTLLRPPKASSPKD